MGAPQAEPAAGLGRPHAPHGGPNACPCPKGPAGTWGGPECPVSRPAPSNLVKSPTEATSCEPGRRPPRSAPAPRSPCNMHAPMDAPAALAPSAAVASLVGSSWVPMPSIGLASRAPSVIIGSPPPAAAGRSALLGASRLTSRPASGPSGSMLTVGVTGRSSVSMEYIRAAPVAWLLVSAAAACWLIAGCCWLSKLSSRAAVVPGRSRKSQEKARVQSERRPGRHRHLCCDRILFWNRLMSQAARLCGRCVRRQHHPRCLAPPRWLVIGRTGRGRRKSFDQHAGRSAPWQMRPPGSTAPHHTPCLRTLGCEPPKGLGA